MSRRTVLVSDARGWHREIFINPKGWSDYSRLCAYTAQWSVHAKAIPLSSLEQTSRDYYGKVSKQNPVNCEVVQWYIRIIGVATFMIKTSVRLLNATALYQHVDVITLSHTNVWLTSHRFDFQGTWETPPSKAKWNQIAWQQWHPHKLQSVFKILW